MTWEEIEKEIKKEEENIQKIVSYLLGGGITFRHKTNTQEGILHPCSESEYVYQFTFFDRLGPVGDFKRNTLEEIARSIREYGFQPCSVEKLQFIS